VRAHGRRCLACGVHGPAARADGRLGARAPTSDGRGHSKTGPASQRRRAGTDAAASTHTQAGPSRWRHGRGEGSRRCADAWDLGSTGQRTREGNEEAGRGEADGRVLLVRTTVFLGRAHGASTMAGASDSTRAKRARGDCGWSGDLSTTARYQYR
jgi:hypothetical protein